MTSKFEITNAMVDKALAIACNQRSVGCGDGDTYTVSVPTFSNMRAAITAALEESGLVEENARLREAVEKARLTFNRYGDLHAAKPDEAKATANYKLADEMDRALNKDQTQ